MLLQLFLATGFLDMFSAPNVDPRQPVVHGSLLRSPNTVAIDEGAQVIKESSTLYKLSADKKTIYHISHKSLAGKINALFRSEANTYMKRQ
jgi:hypothetical protein